MGITNIYNGGIKYENIKIQNIKLGECEDIKIQKVKQKNLNYRDVETYSNKIQ